MRYLYSLLFYFQRTIKGYVARDRFAKIITLFLPKQEYSALSNSDAVLDALKIKGFSSLGSLINCEEIEEINDYLSHYSMFDRYDKRRELFKLEKIPEWANTGSYSDEVLLGCPHIFRLANNPLILDVVGRYLEAKPTIANITLWHSFPAKDKKPKNAEFFHRDVDDFRFVKVFIYLTDVNSDSGPHVYIDESRNSLSLLDIQRYTDEDVFKCFSPDMQRVIFGSKGDAFIEDTYGLHKGTPVLKGKRTVLQFEYSLLPFSIINSGKQKSSFTDAHDSYINRLYK